MEKEIKIVAPKGFEIDKENSTFELIKFKPKKSPKFSDYDGSYSINGFYINTNSNIHTFRSTNFPANRDLFATEQQAKSALAMSQISQIMANDVRFGGAITNQEWKNCRMNKFVIGRYRNEIEFLTNSLVYTFLAFHTSEQRDLFLEENRQLVTDYLMIEE